MTNVPMTAAISRIQGVINELALYLRVINTTPESFWSEVGGTVEYDADMKRKADQKPGEYDAGLNWKDDCIEKSHHVRRNRNGGGGSKSS
mmetsp:Transcript_19345/g.30384  ORF Transcript_19345/g.30384 Transcript_19345/m.30384 type:complete len:90 (-) Transcript_19345:63-332(-)